MRAARVGGAGGPAWFGWPRLRAGLALLLVAALLATPAPPVRAAGSGDGSESRVGVILMVVCGLSLKAAIPAPVPWAGIAIVSCTFGLLDAALSPDGP